jgi:hypothetical protein
MFGYYNLKDPMEQGVVIFKVDLQEAGMKILHLLPHSYFQFWKKWFLELFEKLHSSVKNQNIFLKYTYK